MDASSLHFMSLKSLCNRRNNRNIENTCASQVDNIYLLKNNNYPLATCSNTNGYFNNIQEQQCSALLMKPIDAVHNTQLSFNASVIEEIGMINKKRNAIIDDEVSSVKQMRRNNSDNSLIEQSM